MVDIVILTVLSSFALIITIPSMFSTENIQHTSRFYTKPGCTSAQCLDLGSQSDGSVREWDAEGSKA